MANARVGDVQAEVGLSPIVLHMEQGNISQQVARSFKIKKPEVVLTKQGKATILEHYLRV